MKHQHHKINNHGRDFVIGDLHGCYDILMSHLSALQFDKLKDRLFSVGDVIDRGPDSLKCLQLINEHWFYMVQGNHEEFMIASILDQYPASIDMWLQNGGMWSLEIEDQNILYDLCLKLADLPFAMTIETKEGPVGICHAEPPSVRWSEAQTPSPRDIQTMLWARSRVKHRTTTDIEGITKVYCGHTPTAHPLLLGNVEFIDQGCHYSNTLTIKQIN